MRILLADSQPRIRFALRTLLQQQPGLCVLADVAESDALRAEASSCDLDLILVDWELPGLAEMGGIQGLRQYCPDVSVIAMSGRPGARQAALDSGVDAFVSKSDPPEQLLGALRRCELLADCQGG